MDTQTAPRFFLELTERSEIDTVWFVRFPEERRDYFAVVYRDGPDRPWQGLFRFRHPDNQKSGGYIRPRPDTNVESFRRRMIETFDTAYRMAPAPDQDKWRVEVKGDAFEFMEKTKAFMDAAYEGAPMFAMTQDWPTRES